MLGVWAHANLQRYDETAKILSTRRIIRYLIWLHHSRSLRSRCIKESWAGHILKTNPYLLLPVQAIGTSLSVSVVPSYLTTTCSAASVPLPTSQDKGHPDNFRTCYTLVTNDIAFKCNFYCMTHFTCSFASNSRESWPYVRNARATKA